MNLWFVTLTRDDGGRVTAFSHPENPFRSVGAACAAAAAFCNDGEPCRAARYERLAAPAPPAWDDGGRA